MSEAGELVSREEVMRLVNDVLTSVLDVKAVFLLQHALDAIAALPPVAHVPVAARAAAEEVAKWMNMFHIVPMEVQEQNASTIERIILKHCGSVTPTQKDSGLDA
jgi:hypothetical protein